MKCGEGLGTPLANGVMRTFGCEGELAPDEVFRCVDCGIGFHRSCLRNHFLAAGRPSCSEADQLREEVERLEGMLLRTTSPTKETP